MAAFHTSAPASRGPVMGDTLARLESQVSQLRDEVAELRALVARGAPAPNRTRPVTDPRTDPAAKLQAEVDERQRVAAAESAFRSQPLDANFIQSASRSVHDAFAASDVLRPAVRSIECRSSTCRVEIAADDSATMATDLPAVLSRMASMLTRASAAQIDPGDGHPVTVLYLSR